MVNQAFFLRLNCLLSKKEILMDKINALSFQIGDLVALKKSGSMMIGIPVSTRWIGPYPAGTIGLVVDTFTTKQYSKVCLSFEGKVGWYFNAELRLVSRGQDDEAGTRSCAT
jgi:hypothetical protein